VPSPEKIDSGVRGKFLVRVAGNLNASEWDENDDASTFNNIRRRTFDPVFRLLFACDKQYNCTMGKVRTALENRHNRRSASGPFTAKCSNKWHSKWQCSDESELQICPESLVPIFKKIPGKTALSEDRNAHTSS